MAMHICTWAHACILTHTYICTFVRSVQQNNSRLQNNAKKFIHLCECVLAFMCVCVFVGASQCLSTCVCACVSPPFADCSCHPRKNVPAQQWAIKLDIKKQQLNPHIHNVYKICHKYVVWLKKFAN